MPHPWRFTSLHGRKLRPFCWPNFIAGSDTVGEQQNANAQNADAVVLGAAGAAAQLAHAARAALRGTLAWLRGRRPVARTAGDGGAAR